MVVSMEGRRKNAERMAGRRLWIRGAIEVWKDKSRKDEDELSSVVCEEEVSMMSSSVSAANNYAGQDERLRHRQR